MLLSYQTESSFQKFVLACYLLTAIYRTQKVVNAAPYDQNAIIVIPFKSSDEQITKIKSFKVRSFVNVYRRTITSSN